MTLCYDCQRDTETEPHTADCGMAMAQDLEDKGYVILTPSLTRSTNAITHMLPLIVYVEADDRDQAKRKITHLLDQATQAGALAGYLAPSRAEPKP